MVASAQKRAELVSPAGTGRSLSSAAGNGKGVISSRSSILEKKAIVLSLDEFRLHPHWKQARKKYVQGHVSFNLGGIEERKKREDKQHQHAKQKPSPKDDLRPASFLQESGDGGEGAGGELTDTAARSFLQEESTSSSQPAVGTAATASGGKGFSKGRGRGVLTPTAIAEDFFKDVYDKLPQEATHEDNQHSVIEGVRSYLSKLYEKYARVDPYTTKYHYHSHEPPPPEPPAYDEQAQRAESAVEKKAGDDQLKTAKPAEGTENKEAHKEASEEEVVKVSNSEDGVVYTSVNRERSAEKRQRFRREDAPTDPKIGAPHLETIVSNLRGSSSSSKSVLSSRSGASSSTQTSTQVSAQINTASSGAKRPVPGSDPLKLASFYEYDDVEHRWYYFDGPKRQWWYYQKPPEKDKHAKRKRRKKHRKVWYKFHGSRVSTTSHFYSETEYDKEHSIFYHFDKNHNVVDIRHGPPLKRERLHMKKERERKEKGGKEHHKREHSSSERKEKNGDSSFENSTFENLNPDDVHRESERDPGEDLAARYRRRQQDRHVKWLNNKLAKKIRLYEEKFGKKRENPEKSVTTHALLPAPDSTTGSDSTPRTRALPPEMQSRQNSDAELSPDENLNGANSPTAASFMEMKASIREFPRDLAILYPQRNCEAINKKRVPENASCAAGDYVFYAGIRNHENHFVSVQGLDDKVYDSSRVQGEASDSVKHVSKGYLRVRLIAGLGENEKIGFERLHAAGTTENAHIHRNDIGCYWTPLPEQLVKKPSKAKDFADKVREYHCKTDFMENLIQYLKCNGGDKLEVAKGGPLVDGASTYLWSGCAANEVLPGVYQTTPGDNKSWTSFTRPENANGDVRNIFNRYGNKGKLTDYMLLNRVLNQKSCKGPYILYYNQAAYQYFPREDELEFRRGGEWAAGHDVQKSLVVLRLTRKPGSDAPKHGERAGSQFDCYVLSTGKPCNADTKEFAENAECLSGELRAAGSLEDFTLIGTGNMWGPMDVCLAGKYVLYGESNLDYLEAPSSAETMGYVESDQAEPSASEESEEETEESESSTEGTDEESEEESEEAFIQKSGKVTTPNNFPNLKTQHDVSPNDVPNLQTQHDLNDDTKRTRRNLRTKGSRRKRGALKSSKKAFLQKKALQMPDGILEEKVLAQGLDKPMSRRKARKHKRKAGDLADAYLEFAREAQKEKNEKERQVQNKNEMHKKKDAEDGHKSMDRSTSFLEKEGLTETRGERRTNTKAFPPSKRRRPKRHEEGNDQRYRRDEDDLIATVPKVNIVRGPKRETIPKVIEVHDYLLKNEVDIFSNYYDPYATRPGDHLVYYSCEGGNTIRVISDDRGSGRIFHLIPTATLNDVRMEGIGREKVEPGDVLAQFLRYHLPRRSPRSLWDRGWTVEKAAAFLTDIIDNYGKNHECKDVWTGMEFLRNDDLVWAKVASLYDIFDMKEKVYDLRTRILEDILRKLSQQLKQRKLDSKIFSDEQWDYIMQTIDMADMRHDWELRFLAEELRVALYPGNEAWLQSVMTTWKHSWDNADGDSGDDFIRALRARQLRTDARDRENRARRASCGCTIFGESCSELMCGTIDIPEIVINGQCPCSQCTCCSIECCTGDCGCCHMKLKPLNQWCSNGSCGVSTGIPAMSPDNTKGACGADNKKGSCQGPQGNGKLGGGMDGSCGVQGGIDGKAGLCNQLQDGQVHCCASQGKYGKDGTRGESCAGGSCTCQGQGNKYGKVDYPGKGDPCGAKGKDEYGKWQGGSCACGASSPFYGACAGGNCCGDMNGYYGSDGSCGCKGAGCDQNGKGVDALCGPDRMCSSDEDWEEFDRLAGDRNRRGWDQSWSSNGKFSGGKAGYDDGWGDGQFSDGRAGYGNDGKGWGKGADGMGGRDDGDVWNDDDLWNAAGYPGAGTRRGWNADGTYGKAHKPVGKGWGGGNDLFDSRGRIRMGAGGHFIRDGDYDDDYGSGGVGYFGGGGDGGGYYGGNSEEPYGGGGGGWFSNGDDWRRAEEERLKKIWHNHEEEFIYTMHKRPVLYKVLRHMDMAPFVSPEELIWACNEASTQARFWDRYYKRNDPEARNALRILRERCKGPEYKDFRDWVDTHMYEPEDDAEKIFSRWGSTAEFSELMQVWEKKYKKGLGDMPNGKPNYNVLDPNVSRRPVINDSCVQKPNSKDKLNVGKLEKESGKDLQVTWLKSRNEVMSPRSERMKELVWAICPSMRTMGEKILFDWSHTRMEVEACRGSEKYCPDPFDVLELMEEWEASLVDAESLFYFRLDHISRKYLGIVQSPAEVKDIKALRMYFRYMVLDLLLAAENVEITEKNGKLLMDLVSMDGNGNQGIIRRVERLKYKLRVPGILELKKLTLMPKWNWDYIAFLLDLQEEMMSEKEYFNLINSQRLWKDAYIQVARAVSDEDLARQNRVVQFSSVDGKVLRWWQYYAKPDSYEYRLSVDWLMEQAYDTDPESHCQLALYECTDAGKHADPPTVVFLFDPSGSTIFEKEPIQLYAKSRDTLISWYGKNLVAQSFVETENEGEELGEADDIEVVVDTGAAQVEGKREQNTIDVAPSSFIESSSVLQQGIENRNKNELYRNHRNQRKALRNEQRRSRNKRHGLGREDTKHTGGAQSFIALGKDTDTDDYFGSSSSSSDDNSSSSSADGDDSSGSTKEFFGRSSSESHEVAGGGAGDTEDFFGSSSESSSESHEVARGAGGRESMSDDTDSTLEDETDSEDTDENWGDYGGEDEEISLQYDKNDAKSGKPFLSGYNPNPRRFRATTVFKKDTDYRATPRQVDNLRLETKPNIAGADLEWDFFTEKQGTRDSSHTRHDGSNSYWFDQMNYAIACRGGNMIEPNLGIIRRAGFDPFTVQHRVQCKVIGPALVYPGMRIVKKKMGSYYTLSVVGCILGMAVGYLFARICIRFIRVPARPAVVEGNVVQNHVAPQHQHRGAPPGLLDQGNKGKGKGNKGKGKGIKGKGKGNKGEGKRNQGEQNWGPNDRSWDQGNQNWDQGDHSSEQRSQNWNENWNEEDADRAQDNGGSFVESELSSQHPVSEVTNSYDDKDAGDDDEENAENQEASRSQDDSSV